jgi:hypothetical protein
MLCFRHNINATNTNSSTDVSSFTKIGSIANTDSSKIAIAAVTNTTDTNSSTDTSSFTKIGSINNTDSSKITVTNTMATFM